MLLVRRGLARSRGHARDLIAAGQVRADGIPATKASAPVTPGTVLQLADETPSWVGRGAGKLLAALEQFGAAGLRVAGRRCLDVGAGTGGFTQALLHHGAAHVVALDVGHGQLAAALRADPRVTERSGTNIRNIGADPAAVTALGGPFDLVVADLSFISLRLVVGTLAGLTDPDGDLVLLVKPQFEVGRARLGKGGLVRSDPLRLQAVRGVVAAADAVGLGLADFMPSPVPGTTGNREYLGWWTPRSTDRPSETHVERLLTAMVQDRQDPPRARTRERDPEGQVQ